MLLIPFIFYFFGVKSHRSARTWKLLAIIPCPYGGCHVRFSEKNTLFAMGMRPCQLSLSAATPTLSPFFPLDDLERYVITSMISAKELQSRKPAFSKIDWVAFMTGPLFSLRRSPDYFRSFVVSSQNFSLATCIWKWRNNTYNSVQLLKGSAMQI